MVGLIQSGQLKSQDPQTLSAVSTPVQTGLGGQAQEQMPQEPMQQETQEPAGGGFEEATPDEQEGYEKLVLAGMKLLYDEKTNDKVVSMLKQGADNPPKALAQVSMMVFSEIDKASGGTVPEMVIAQGIDALLEEVATIAQESGAFVVDDQTAAQAREEMMLALGEQFGADDTDVQELMGSFSPEEVERLRREHEAAAGVEESPVPTQQPTQEPMV